MKFLALFAAGAVATSIGSPVVKKASLVERDLAAITSAIQAVSDATATLQTAVEGFSGAGDVAGLQGASTDLISAIEAGTSAATASEDLTPDEALQLTSPIQSLAAQVSSSVDAVIAQRDAFDAAGVSTVVRDQLTTIRDDAAAFSAAILDKVPDDLQQIGQSLAQPIADDLDRAVQAYADATGGGASSTASPTASGSASSSASASATTTAAGSTVVYPTGSAPASTTTAATTYPVGGNGTSTPSVTSPVTPPIATGGAASAAAGYGAIAMAAIAAVAAF